MSTGPNPIVVLIRDGVDPNIAVKLDAISASSRTAQGGITQLQQTLGTLNSGGLVGLSRTIGGISTSTAGLTKNITANGNAAIQASGQITKLADSYATLALRMGVALSTLQAFSQAATQANGGVLSFRNNITGAGQAAAGAGLSSFQASSSLKVLQGNAMGASLAAGALIRQSEFMSTVLAAAFPVIGAVALVEILAVIVGKVIEVVDHFRDLTTAIDLIPSKIGAVEEAVKKLTDQTRSAAIEAQRYNIQKEFPTNSNDPATRALNVMKQANAIGSIDIDESLRKQSLEQINLKTITDQLHIAENQLTVAKQIQAIKQAGGNPNQTLQDNVFGSPGPVQNLPVKSGLSGVLENPIGIKNVFNTIQSTKDLTLGSETDVDKAISKVAELRDAARQGQAEVDKAAQDVVTQGAKTSLDRVNATNKSIKDLGTAQLRQFKEQMDALKIADAGGPFSSAGKATNEPVSREQDLTNQLNLIKTQEQTASETNLIKLKTQEATVTQELTRVQQAHESDVTNVIQRYRDEANAVGLYSDALKEQQLWDKATLQIQKDKSSFSPQEQADLKATITYYVETADYQRALTQEYNVANEPLRRYNASQQALTTLLAKGSISQQQYNDQSRLATKSYNDAINPLYEWNHGIQDQINLFGIYGDALSVASQSQQIQNIERDNGRKLTDAQTVSLNQFLTELNNESNLNSDLNKIYDTGAGALQKLVTEQLALNAARKNAKQLGVGTDQLNQLSAQNAVGQSKINIAQGDGTGKDYLTTILGTYASQFKGFATEVDNLFTDVFSNIANQAGSAIGAAIAGTESWSDAAKQLGRSFISDVTGGLIKIAIQWALMKALGTALGTSASATSIAQGASVAAAWTPAAVAVDIATFGAASAAADLALVTSFGLGTTLSAVTGAIGTGKNQGGWVSGAQLNPYVDTVLTPTVPGEFVVNAIDSQRNAADLQRINSGGRAVGNGGQMNVQIIHDGSTAIQTQQVNENTVKVIAKRVAEDAVNEHAPRVIAADLQNPNSKTSKAIKNNVQAPRRH